MSLPFDTNMLATMAGPASAAPPNAAPGAPNINVSILGGLMGTGLAEDLIDPVWAATTFQALGVPPDVINKVMRTIRTQGEAVQKDMNLGGLDDIATNADAGFAAMENKVGISDEEMARLDATENALLTGGATRKGKKISEMKPLRAAFALPTDPEARMAKGQSIGAFFSNMADIVKGNNPRIENIHAHRNAMLEGIKSKKNYDRVAKAEIAKARMDFKNSVDLTKWKTQEDYRQQIMGTIIKTYIDLGYREQDAALTGAQTIAKVQGLESGKVITTEEATQIAKDAGVKNPTPAIISTIIANGRAGAVEYKMNREQRQDTLDRTETSAERDTREARNLEHGIVQDLFRGALGDDVSELLPEEQDEAIGAALKDNDFDDNKTNRALALAAIGRRDSIDANRRSGSLTQKQQFDYSNDLDGLDATIAKINRGEDIGMQAAIIISNQLGLAQPLSPGPVAAYQGEVLGMLEKRRDRLAAVLSGSTVGPEKASVGKTGNPFGLKDPGNTSSVSAFLDGNDKQKSNPEHVMTKMVPRLTILLMQDHGHGDKKVDDLTEAEASVIGKKIVEILKLDGAAIPQDLQIFVPKE